MAVRHQAFQTGRRQTADSGVITDKRLVESA